MGLKNTIARTPVVGRCLLVPYRARLGWGYFSGPLLRLVKWLVVSKEVTNFTYDLEATNKLYLASMIAEFTGADPCVVWGYIGEIETDVELREHVKDATKKSDLSHLADLTVSFGRRIGWYAIARILKPKVIVETGVEKGLGACVLAAALRRNALEGHAGRYYGTDINPGAGYLFGGEYAKCGEILYGDSIESLRKLDVVIDLFINDSDHSADYEAAEYETVAGKLSDRAVLLGDNAHVTDKLLRFSLATGRHFLFFRENPRDHWYPGAGIGISFSRIDAATRH